MDTTTALRRQKNLRTNQMSLGLWSLSLVLYVVILLITINAGRYYVYRQQPPVTTAPEVYWMAPQVFDSEGGQCTSGCFVMPGGWNTASPQPTNGAGYANYSTAYGTGLLATYSEIQEALERGLTVNRWGFFDGQCGTLPPTQDNPRGKYCAINCCTSSPCIALDSQGKGKQPTTNSCKRPSGAPTSGSPCCMGNTPSSPTAQACDPCFSPDKGLPQLNQCTAWYAENDGVFVACPQQNKGAPAIPLIPGGPWDANGNGGVSQPTATVGSVNAYQINQQQTLNFGTISQSDFPLPNRMQSSNWQFRMGYEANPPGGTAPSNPWAGAFIVGVKPPPGTPGVLPFDVTGNTANSNNGWNDPNAIANQTQVPFVVIPTSQVILFSVAAAMVVLLFGVMWFRSTRLGETLGYWL